MDPGFCWPSWVSHCGCWALFFHTRVSSPEPFLLEWGKEVGRTIMEIIQGMLEIGRDHSPFLVLLKLSLGLPIPFFFFKYGRGKKRPIWENEVCGNTVSRGHCWDINGAVGDFYFFFWLSEEKSCHIHVVCVGFGPPLWFLLCCRPIRVVCIQAGGFGLASGEQLARLLKGFTVPG